MGWYMEDVRREMPEELSGVEEYMKLAHEAKMQGRHEHAQMLRDIAKEEYTHAKHLKCMLDSVHMEYPDYREKMEKAEESLHNW